MEIDKDKIKKRFSEINESLSQIKKITSLPDKEFWSEKEHLAAVKYYLLQAIEATGGVCVHIAAKKFNKGVSSFGECFEILEKEKFLNKDLARQLRQMVKFRNKLIHQYWEINDELVLKYSKNNLDDFRKFMKAIDKLI